MTYKLGTRSLQSLSGVHPDMVAVVKRAIEITEQDFTVIEGIRNVNRQRALLKAGKSTTMNSRHITGHAVDMVTGRASTMDRTSSLTESLIQNRGLS